MRARDRRIILAILFSAGFCGLVDELAWIRALTLAFGGTVEATAAVLCAFMAGLSLGGWIGGILADRYRPMSALAVVQAGLGVLSIALLPVFARAPEIYAFLVRSLGIGETSFLWVKVAFSVVLLIVPASLISMAFPLVTKLCHSRLGPGANVGSVYGVDTLGAVAGAGVAGFVLLRDVGNTGTLAIAAGINCALGAFCFLYSKKVAFQGSDSTLVEQAPRTTVVSPGVSVAQARWLGASFALSGAAALSYELLATKVLVHVLQMRIFSVTVMLMCFLGGMGVGSLLCRKLLSHIKSPLLGFVYAEALCALLGFSLPLQFPAVPWLKNALDHALARFQYLGLGWLSDSLACVGVLFVPALVMGATFPLLVEALGPGLRRLGRDVGGLYSRNTLGAVAGVLFMTFVVLPHVSYTWAFCIAGGMYLVAALMAMRGSGGVSRWKRRGFPAALVVLSAVLGFVSFRIPLERILLARTPDAAHDQVQFFKEGPAGSVAVVRTADARVGFTEQMLVNGHLEGGSDIASLRAFELLGNLPFLYHAETNRPLRVLVLAFGMGITLGQVTKHAVDSVTCVELAPEVLAASPHFARFNDSVLTKKNIKIYIEDARSFLLTATTTFDIIIMDATHPTHGDSWMLYTRECYEAVKRRLEPDGVMAQWIPLHGMTMDAYYSVLHTAQATFPHLGLWVPSEGSHSIIVGTPADARIDLRRIETWASDAAVQSDLALAEIADVCTMLSYFVGGEAAIARLTAGAALNTDDLAPVQFAKGFVLTSESVALERSLSDLKFNSAMAPDSAVDGASLDSASSRRLSAANQANVLGRTGTVLREMERFVKDEYKSEIRLRIAKVYQQAHDVYPDDRDAAVFLGLAPLRIRK